MSSKQYKIVNYSLPLNWNKWEHEMSIGDIIAMVCLINDFYIDKNTFDKLPKAAKKYFTEIESKTIENTQELTKNK